MSGTSGSLRRPVRALSPEVARKIAAGEVIDRPNAIVRELMDNAVDSGADTISVEIDGGGIERIRVSDNGSGMTKDDLAACARPHATSKITDAADLMKLTTLGFRGEALASIAAVSRLTILSGNWKMSASITEDHVLSQIPAVQNGNGTIVMSEGLFENYPARRRFLKRPASETMMCRETFVEKALPRTDISFRLKVDGQLRLDLDKGVSLTDRFVSALEINMRSERFATLKASSGSEWTFNLVIGDPMVYRNDRKQIYIYVNGRRVIEYSLVQAIEYGCQGFFPNGTHPVAALFAEVDPSLVDFNIHPAKKEVRFKDSSGLHHGVSSAVRDYFRSYGIKSSQEFEDKDTETQSNIPGFDFDYPAICPPRTKVSSTSQTKMDTGLRSRFFGYENVGAKASYSNDHISRSLAAEAAMSIAENNMAAPQFTAPDKDKFCYIGTVLDCFLVAQVDDTIYFIDQHAAHERILFDKLISSKPEKQSLLVPYVIETDDETEDQQLIQALPLLEEAGFTGQKTDEGKFEFSSVPARWKGTQDDLRSSLLEKTENPKDIIYSVAAMTACRAAVKDGYILDRGAAEALAREALSLPDPHCPHGRPVWTTLTKEQLFARVRRTR